MTGRNTRTAASALGLSLALALAAAAQAQAPPKPLSAGLADYLDMPITGDPAAKDGRSQLARVNYLVEEPGMGRAFVTDQAGPLYILDKQAKRVTPYIDFKALFPRFTADNRFATGLIGVALDPDYRRNGKFYTVHTEDTTVAAPPEPRSGVAGVDVSAYGTTPAAPAPAGSGPNNREGVILEWTDRDVRDAAFQGSVRELLRIQTLTGVHTLSDLSFNPAARPGDPDWRMLFIGMGDGGMGEQNDVRRLAPQRLDYLGGKISRIMPDLGERARAAQVSENGKYRIPNDNPFAATPGARKEIWTYGLRNPHRMAWDVTGPGRSTMVLFVIGSNSGAPRYETIDIVRRGGMNFAYPLREGPGIKPASAVYGPALQDNTLPLRVSDTLLLKRVPVQDSALAYQTTVEGNAIAGGFVYRGRKWPQLRGAVVFADVTSGRLFYARMADLVAATDSDIKTMAPYTEIKTDLRSLVAERVRARSPATKPLDAPGRPGEMRIDVRLATDSDGEIYVLTKTDGMVRRLTSLD